MNSQSSIKAPLSIWSFLFGFILIFSFFTQKLSLDIGFHLKAFMFFSTFTLFYISVTKVKVNFIFELHDLIFLIFILYGGTTVIYAADQLSTLRMFFGSLIMFFCYFSVKLFFINYSFKISDVERLLYFSSLSFIIISLIMYFYGMYIIAGDFQSYEHIRVSGVFVERATPRLIGLVLDPNIFVVYVTPIFFYLLLKINKNIFDFIALTLTVLCILLSLSRGGILAILSVVLMLFFLKTIIALVNGILNKKILTWLLILSIVFIFIFHSLDIHSNISSIIERRISSIADGSGRVDIWKNLLSLWAENPIFGIGWYNFLHYNIELFDRANYAHNTYLEVLVETGLVGFTLYTSFLLVIIHRVITLVYQKPELNYLLYSLLSILVSFVFLSLIINEIFFLLLAIISIFSYKTKLNNA